MYSTISCIGRAHPTHPTPTPLRIPIAGGGWGNGDRAPCDSCIGRVGEGPPPKQENRGPKFTLYFETKLDVENASEYSRDKFLEACKELEMVKVG